MNPYDEDDDFDEEQDALELEAMTEEKDVSGEGITVQVHPNCFDRIAEAAAHRIELALHKRVEEMVAKRIDAMLDEAWKSTISAMAEKAITDYLTAPRAKTNQWGESIDGKTTMLSALIPETVSKWLTEKVDRDGRADSYGHGGTRMQWLLQKLVIEQLDAETKKAVSSITEKARSLVAQQVGRFVSEQMVPAISVDGKGAPS